MVRGPTCSCTFQYDSLEMSCEPTQSHRQSFRMARLGNGMWASMPVYFPCDQVQIQQEDQRARPPSIVNEIENGMLVSIPIQTSKVIKISMGASVPTTSPHDLPWRWHVGGRYGHTSQAIAGLLNGIWVNIFIYFMKGLRNVMQDCMPIYSTSQCYWAQKWPVSQHVLTHQPG